MVNRQPKIVLGVTASRSLNMLTGLSKQLVSDGWEVHIAVDPGPETAIFDNTPITVHKLPMQREPAWKADVKALYRWRRLLKRLRPDVVMVGTPKAGLLGIIGARLAGVPVRIYHLRGLRLESIRGVKRVVLKSVEKATFTFSTHVLSVSESLKALVANLGLVQSNKVTVLGRGSSKGVDLLRFAKEYDSRHLKDKLHLDSKLPVVGFVGRVSRDKGSRELLRASQRLFEEGVDHQLLIVGGIDDAEGQDQVLPNGLKRAPVFAGHVKDVAPYYRLMDVLCLPTHREGFPNVVLEAGIAGVPTVTTNATGAIDSVISGHTGMIVPKGSVDELTLALRKLLLDEDLRLQLGEKVRRFVRENYDEGKVLKATSRYLRSLLMDLRL